MREKKAKKPKNESYIRRRELEQITPDQWREKILMLPSEIRSAVARIIWWDFFSQKTVRNRWSQLDDMLVGPDIPGEEIRAGLEQLGFTQKMSQARISCAD